MSTPLCLEEQCEFFPQRPKPSNFRLGRDISALPFEMPIHFKGQSREGIARPAVWQARCNWVKPVKTGRNRPLAGGRNRFSRAELLQRSTCRLWRACQTGRRNILKRKDSKQGEWQSAIECCCGYFTLNPAVRDFDFLYETSLRAFYIPEILPYLF